MSLTETAAMPDRRPSPGLNFNFSSNNPFRNRAVSPSSVPSPPSSGLNRTQGRPVSNNPFLDITETQPASTGSAGATAMSSMNNRASPTKPALSGHTAELFSNLTLDDKSTSPQHRRENIPPRPMGRGPPPHHRGTGSREEERRRAAGKPTDTLDIFADPPDSRHRRPRRNSDTSVVDRSSKYLDPEADRRRRERRHREARHADRKHHGASKSRKPARNLDIIDKLDVTSIYGTGLFHHDGPFDACNPHRNRKGHRAAPMQAFPKDSTNNSLGGSGPVHSNINLAQFHGLGDEGYKDYGNKAGEGVKGRRPSFDRSHSQGYNPMARIEPVHGDETLGLGTSTFLEGAPASRHAIARRESENEAQMLQAGSGGGLQRKKSLAQKIRGMNSRPGRTMSPENAIERTTSPTSPQSVGSATRRNETNPFFQDYDAAYDQKGAKIAAVEEKAIGRARAPSSPRRGLSGLERRITNDGTPAEDFEATLANGNGTANGLGNSSGTIKTGGFLNRVKSLKGGTKRIRPDRKESAP